MLFVIRAKFFLECGREKENKTTNDEMGGTDTGVDVNR